MYCKKCGKEISENMKFCTYCGAVQDDASSSVYSQPVNVHDSKKKETKKKKKVTKASLLVGVIAAALAMYGQWSASSSSKTKSNEEDFVVETTTEEANPEYEKIFSDRNIIHMSAVMVGDTAAFAKVGDDGTIECLEFGYKDDIIHTMVQTIFIDISDLSEEQRQVMDETARENYSAYENLEFVTITSNIGNSYYKISCKAEGLDDEDTLQTAEDNGVVETTGSGELMSMNLTGIELRAGGYVEK